MTEDKYAGLREVIANINDGCGFIWELDEYWQVITTLLVERDALIKEREENSWHIPSYESIFNKCQFGIYVGTCDYTCGPTTCPKMREDQK